MIESLKIKNFQSHEDSELTFADGLNIIIGKTDSGKSAIKRALYLLRWNRPAGDHYRSKWGGKTLVRIKTSEGDSISRIKDTGINKYVLNKESFTAFKSEIPEEIVSALNMNEINIQSQFDSPFLLHNSSGEVAVHFNKIAHIDKIDSSLKAIESTIRGIKQNNEHLKSSLKEVDEELSKYDFLDRMESEIEEVEELDRKIQQKENYKLRLSSSISIIQGINQIVEKASIWTDLEVLVDSVLDTISEIEFIVSKNEKLKQLINLIKSVSTMIEKESDLIELENKIIPILDMYASIEKWNQKLDSLDSHIAKISKVEDRIQQLETANEKLHKTFHANMPDICPLCDQPIK